MRARKVVGAVVTTKLYIYNQMNINNKNTKKQYPANTNLLGADWVPLGTLLFSCTYAPNQIAVTSGNHVKLCKWLPRKPRFIRLWQRGNHSNHGNHHFFYLYTLFLYSCLLLLICIKFDT